MKKDIYVIRNTVNDKVYVGQAKNAAERWLKHLSAARRGYNYVISKAMRKHGIQNFYYQILEYQVENYDERECYWIEKLCSRVPNGYNVTPGGSSGKCGIDHPLSTFDSLEDVLVVIDALQNSKLSMQKIAEQIGCAESVISQINLGATYRVPSIDYPIRKTRYESELIKQIHYSLQYESDKSMPRIAKEYHVDLSQINLINQGRLHALPGKSYPLRSGCPFSLNKDKVDDIITALQNSEEQMKDIARHYNVSQTFISGINKGNLYRRDDISYPIRQTYQGFGNKRVCFSPDELIEIKKDLRSTSKSIRAIAKEHETSYQTIMNINNGTILKYHNNKDRYPLRKITK